MPSEAQNISTATRYPVLFSTLSLDRKPSLRNHERVHFSTRLVSALSMADSVYLQPFLQSLPAPTAGLPGPIGCSFNDMVEDVHRSGEKRIVRASRDEIA